MKTAFALFGAIHLVADIAIISFLWWWSRIPVDEAEGEIDPEEKRPLAS